MDRKRRAQAGWKGPPEEREALRAWGRKYNRTLEQQLALAVKFSIATYGLHWLNTPEGVAEIEAHGRDLTDEKALFERQLERVTAQMFSTEPSPLVNPPAPSTWHEA